MTLYHFCSEKHVRKIKAEGLRLGAVAVWRKHNLRIYEGYNWLTLDGDPQAQSWATTELIRYRRTAWRLTVEIPDEECDRLMDEEALEAHIPGSRVLFTGWPGSENWRVYKGFIPPGWIKKIEKMDE